MEGKELGLPWRIASQNYETCFYVIHGKDYTATDGREIQILCMHYGSHPIKEHKDRIKANAEIIVEAVNNYAQLQSELEKAKELIKMAQNLTAGTSKESFERFDKFMKQAATFLEGSGNKTK